jgi:hypothetical protein
MDLPDSDLIRNDLPQRYKVPRPVVDAVMRETRPDDRGRRPETGVREVVPQLVEVRRWSPA